MSDIKGLLTQPGLTNAQAYLLNWIMLAFVVVEWTVCFFIADEGMATRMVGVTTGVYAGSLLTAPYILRLVRPGVQVERKRAWLAGLAGFGGVALFLQLRSAMLALFG